jgi:hypothetical protein
MLTKKEFLLKAMEIIKETQPTKSDYINIHVDDLIELLWHTYQIGVNNK